MMANQVTFTISNITATADLKQKVNIEAIGQLPCGIHDVAIYGGRCGYIKLPNMKGKVTIFPSGKMISVGAKSEMDAHNQIFQATHYLIQNKLIKRRKPICQTQNIVVTVSLGEKLPIDRMTQFLPKSVYDPSTFPAVICKILGVSYLIFQSGKIVISGLKSESGISKAVFEVREKINHALHSVKSVRQESKN